MEEFRVGDKVILKLDALPFLLEKYGDTVFVVKSTKQVPLGVCSNCGDDLLDCSCGDSQSLLEVVGHPQWVCVDAIGDCSGDLFERVS